MPHFKAHFPGSCLLALAFMATPALADVGIYRGVDANAKSGQASLARGQFRFNPDLSTFNDPALAPVQKACNYRFTVVLQGAPAVGAHGPVQGLVMLQPLIIILQVIGALRTPQMSLRTRQNRLSPITQKPIVVMF